MIDLLLASNNSGKLEELRTLLPADIVIKTFADLEIESPEETGTTFAENAAIKAVYGARASGILTLADDSGLEVAALGGKPGVRSARYAGVNATDQENIDMLLADMKGIRAGDRAAEFVCVLAIANTEGVLASATGRCAGSIGFAMHGDNGFGYDPIFRFDDGRSMAELDPTEKNLVGHRGQALRHLLPSLLIAIGIMRFATQELVNDDHATQPVTLRNV